MSIMATCGGYSFERTLLETIELMELKNTNYTDLELAALVGETLRKATTSQDEEIARLKCLIEERNEELKTTRIPILDLQRLAGEELDNLSIPTRSLKLRVRIGQLVANQCPGHCPDLSSYGVAVSLNLEADFGLLTPLKFFEKQKKLCPSFASLESMYDQPMTQLSNGIAFLRKLNEECETKIRRYQTLLKCSTDDQQSLARVFHDLNTSKNDERPSSHHCILCRCAGDKESLDRLRRDRMQGQLTDMIANRDRMENELAKAVAEREITQDEIDDLSRQVGRLTAIVVKVEKEDCKSKRWVCDSDDELGCRNDGDLSLRREGEKKQDYASLNAPNTSNRCRKCRPVSPEIYEKPSPGKFVSAVQSLMLK